MSEQEKPKKKKYATKPRVLEIEIDDKPYTIVGLDGAGRGEYMEARTRSIKAGKDGKPTGTMDVRNMEVDLIHRCLREEGNKQIDPGVIKKWPGDVIADLFQDCQQLSGLGDKAEEEAKND